MRVKITVCVLLFLATAALAPFFGMETIGPGSVFSPGMESDIFWKLRVPRVLCGLLAGGALAVGGMVFQAVFRNPLATPFTLGTASGASLGASLAIHFGWTFTLGAASPVILAAFGGAMLALGCVFGIVRASGKHRSHTDMLLAGVAVSFLFASLIMLLQYVNDPTQTVRMLRWTMGGLERGGGFQTLNTLLPWCVVGLIFIAIYWRELDLCSMGEDVATARGMNPARTRWTLLAGTSLMVGSVVALCGPIGFLGLIVPHAARRMVGATHRVLLPVTFLGGSVLLVWCDTLARCTLPPDEIPVGIFTALLGGPFFIAILIGRKDKT